MHAVAVADHDDDEVAWLLLTPFRLVREEDDENEESTRRQSSPLALQSTHCQRRDALARERQLLLLLALARLWPVD